MLGPLMKRKTAKPDLSDDLEPEYDFDSLGPVVRGKYVDRLADVPEIAVPASTSGVGRTNFGAGFGINGLMERIFAGSR